MLTRLIYASETTEPLSPTAVQDIVDRAQVHNARRHLTGLLVFDHRSFLQVLEGHRAALSALFARIGADPRHQRIELIEVRPIDERRFSRWGMGFAAADASRSALYLRFGGSPEFDPYHLTAAGAMGLLEALAAPAARAADRG